MFIPPGPGDESISIGAAFLELVKNGMQVSDINSPSDGYFGPSHSEDSVKQAIDKHAKPDWNVRKVKPSDVAELIANGDVVSRFGLESMEFGARALGNRSIIADPRRPDVIHHINKLVKMRDFWMPFALSILAERENDYMINQGIDGRFIMHWLRFNRPAKEHLPAGLHPFDRSARPQIVHKER